MSDADRIALATAINRKRDLEYAADAAVWAREQVLTQDEEAKAVLVPWPAAPYNADLFEVLQREKKVAFPKSRRMMVTWTVAAWFCHQARYFPGFAGYIQSRIEGLSSFVLTQRCQYIEENLRTRSLRREWSWANTEAVCKKTGSRIYAVAQGAHAFRGPTPTAVFMDETEYWDEAQQSLDAALPFLEGNAQIILASTSGGPSGTLAKICKSASFVRHGGVAA